MHEVVRKPIKYIAIESIYSSCRVHSFLSRTIKEHMVVWEVQVLVCHLFLMVTAPAMYMAMKRLKIFPGVTEETFSSPKVLPQLLGKRQVPPGDDVGGLIEVAQQWLSLLGSIKMTQIQKVRRMFLLPYCSRFPTLDSKLWAAELSLEEQS